MGHGKGCGRGEDGRLLPQTMPTLGPMRPDRRWGTQQCSVLCYQADAEGLAAAQVGFVAGST